MKPFNTEGAEFAENKVLHLPIVAGHAVTRALRAISPHRATFTFRGFNQACLPPCSP